MASQRSLAVVRWIERYLDDEMPLDVVCPICGVAIGTYCDDRHGLHAVRGLAIYQRDPPCLLKVSA